MKTLRFIFGGFILLVLVVLGVGLLMPRTISVERTRLIQAPPHIVFDLIDDFRAFNAWSPWTADVEQVRFDYFGPKEGVGHKMQWQSPDPSIGYGHQEILSLKHNEFIRTAISFGDRGRAFGYFALDPVGEATSVRWGFQTDLGVNPLARYYGLVMPGQIRSDFDQGLDRLAAMAEQHAQETERDARPDAGPARGRLRLAQANFVPDERFAALLEDYQPQGSIDPMMDLSGMSPDALARVFADVEPAAGPMIALGTVAPVTLALFETRSGSAAEDKDEALGSAFFKLNEFRRSHDLDQAGFARTIHLHQNEDQVNMLAAIPVRGDPANVPDGVRLAESYSGTVVRGVHVGPYSEIDTTYDQLAAFIERQGLEVVGPAWEEYAEMPETTPEDRLVTFIFFPIAEPEL